MSALFVTISLAFIEGFALIISPCILPVLPIVLSGSLTGNKSRPLGIIVGFILTFTVVTLFSRALLEYVNISPDVLRNFSFIILILLGVMMLSTYLTEKFNVLTQRLTNVGSQNATINNIDSGFSGGMLFGALIGVIWTPCAGPILAAVIVQVVIQETTLRSMLTVIAFAIGAGLPMLAIAVLGRSIMTQFSYLRTHTALLRKLLGLIIILSVVYLHYATTATAVFTKVDNSQPATSLLNGITPYQAPEISGIDAWINSPPLKMSELRGKVVLIDFWTYSCINCIRTLPYLKDWYEKYHDKGLIIIGVHSPEFQFEHDLQNVKNAVIKDGITYPVALDNQFVTWRQFQNQYWPAHYLINKNGDVVYRHFGEGEYDVTENNIRYLLGVKEAAQTKPISEKVAFGQTPETYFGYARAERFKSPEAILQNKINHYSYPSHLAQNEWALNGKWTVMADRIVSGEKNAAIKLHFYAGKVYAVMGMVGKSIIVKVVADDKMLSQNDNKGVINAEIIVDHNQLYTIVDNANAQDGTVELIANDAGLELYTFTFGS